MSEQDQPTSSSEPANFEREHNRLLDQMTQADDVMYDILKKAPTPQNRKLAAIVSDMTNLISGMLQNRISNGQPRVFRDYLEYVELSSELDLKSKDAHELDLLLRVAIGRATELGLTAENQALVLDSKQWRQRTDRAK